MRLGPGYHFSENLTDQVFFFFRGAIIKKKPEKFPNGEGGVNFFLSKKSQFQFGNFENPGGGLNFSKMSQSQLFCNYFAILPL